MNKADPGNGILYEPQSQITVPLYTACLPEISVASKCLENNNRGQQFIQRVFFTKTLETNMHICAEPKYYVFASGKQRTPMARKHLLCPKGKINWHSALGMTNTFPYPFSEHHGSVLPPFCLQCTGTPLSYDNEPSFWPLHLHFPLLPLHTRRFLFPGQHCKYLWKSFGNTLYQILIHPYIYGWQWLCYN